MGKLTKKDMEEIRDILSLGCEYADTKTVIHEIADKTLSDMGMDLGIECMSIVEGCGENDIELEDFVDNFYTAVIEDVLNVVETQESEDTEYIPEKIKDLLERAAEEIENLYGKETELTEEIRKSLDS
jgi:hypothetical protein